MSFDHETLNHLFWIENQYPTMVKQIIDFSSIIADATSVDGLHQMHEALKQSFACLNGETKEYPLAPFKSIDQEGKLIFQPLGKALHFIKRAESPLQIFFGGHMDSFSDPHSSIIQEGNILKGPGIADMKSGLVILLTTLLAFERLPDAKKIGWQVFINPDESLGSPGSAYYLVKIARKCHIGMLFEPSTPSSELISFRKGSANYTIVAKGRSAHIGRDPAIGRNAITALAEFINFIEKLNSLPTGLIINIGSFHGGVANHIVAPNATCQINIRANDQRQIIELEKKMVLLLSEISQKREVELKLFPIIHRPPKFMDAKTHALLADYKQIGKKLGVDLKIHGTGSVCDSNILAAEGLPTLDTLGAKGGNLHTSDEFIFLDQLVDKVKMNFLFLKEFLEK